MILIASARQAPKRLANTRTYPWPQSGATLPNQCSGNINRPHGGVLESPSFLDGMRVMHTIRTEEHN